MRSLRCLVVLLPLLPILASCSEPETSAAAGEVTAHPNPVDFGGVYLSQTGRVDVSFTNAGAKRVRLRVAEVEAPFAVEPEEIEIAGGAVGVLTFSFAPTAVGEASGRVRLAATGAKNRELVLDVVGVGLSTDVHAEALDFGDVPVGASKTLPLAIESRSDGPLTLQLELRGSDAGAFSLGQGSLELGPGATGTVEVTFTPRIQGVHGAQVTITACSTCAPHAVLLSGNGAVSDLRPSPATVDFGFVSHGKVATKGLRITNAGALPVTVKRVVFDNASGPDLGFSDLDRFPMTVGGRESADLTLTFSPSAEEMRWDPQYATLSFYDEEDLLLFQVPVTGTPGGPELVANPAAIDFGQQPVGLRLAGVLFTVRNMGQLADVDLYQARLEGEDTAGRNAFTVQKVVVDDRGNPLPDPTYPVNVGREAVNYLVTYNPTGEGEHYAEVVLETSDPEQPQVVVPVSGIARRTAPCDLEIRPPEIRFGLVPNNSEQRKTVSVVNVGTDDCIVWDFRLAVEGSPFFSTVGAPSTTTVIPPGGTLPIGVRFAPVGFPDQMQTSTLSFAHSYPGAGRIEVPVSGFPSRFNVRVIPDPIAFQPGPVGLTQHTAFAIRNAGNDAFTVDRIDLASGTSDEFRIYGGSVDVAPGSQASMNASYQARDVGTDQGQVYVWLRDVPEPAIVALVGTGTDEACDDRCALPQAICPADIVTNVNNQVMLQGGADHPGQRPTTCTWAVATAPRGSRAAPDAAAQCTTPFLPDIVGEYSLQLTVSDDIGQTDSCFVTVRANPFGGLWVETFWSPAGDIDLHLVHPGAGDPVLRSSWTHSTYTCYFANCQPRHTPLEWDTPSPNDNPSLDRDDIPGSGPENIRINQPSSEHPYHVGFRNYSNRNSPTVTYNVYCGGALVHTQNYRSTTVQEVVYVGDVQYYGTNCSFTHRNVVIPP